MIMIHLYQIVHLLKYKLKQLYFNDGRDISQKNEP